MINILKELSETISYLTDRDSQFYSHFLADVDRIVVSKDDKIIDTAAIVFNKLTNRMQFAINPTFWLTLDSNCKRGLCKHKVLHIVLQHIYLDTENIYKDKKIFGIAIDLEVNQYIPKQELTMDGKYLGVHIDDASFKELNFGKLKGVKYYYDKLIQAKNDSNTSDKLKKLLESDNKFDVHSWDNLRGVSKVDLEEMKSATNNKINIIKSELKDIGNLSDVLEGIVPNIKVIHKVKWESVLRMFCANSMHVKIRKTIRKDSDRFPQSKGRWIQRKLELLILLDTSGSMDLQHTINLCFQEIYKIWKRSNCKIQIAEIDTEVKRVYEYKGKTPETVLGRGGTDFTEGIKLANKLRPNGVLYFTDSFAAEPNIRCKKRLLWVLTEDAKNNDLSHLKGRKIFIE